MIYVALLRGINVGGNNKIDMKQLKEAFEQAGMKYVKTYINSGNIIFASDINSKRQLSELLEEVILKRFDLRIKVLIRDFNDIVQVIDSLPASWTNDDQMKSDVLFLWEEIDDPAVIDKLKLKPEIDHVIYVNGAILWSVERSHVTRSGLVKIIEMKDIYHKITVRNVNTTRKIFELMREAQDKASVN